MAKKLQKEEPKVFCKDCFFGGTVENYLIDCSNKQANPDGYKKGCWAHVCRYYEKKRDNGNRTEV